jgi:hypothetical protein
MTNTEGMAIKFTVIKNEDVSKHLNDSEVNMFSMLLSRVMAGRVFEGKKPENTYLVINTDESYAQEIINILKAHGHWGG